MIQQEQLTVQTRGRGTQDITGEVQRIVGDAGVETGLCNVFLHHTSASLILCENADPDVRHDLETFMQRLVPDGDPMFIHTTEGPDDMPAHVRAVLTSNSISVPITGGRCSLGTWQGIYIWEHRHSAQRRRVTLTVYGE
ncbi:MAG: secondary thiamine-phosphate synthase enzyme YjbQ [Gammaproteobacteria bacterium]|nr:secondary thiamine-phosphate synthase enzyme YjbQ [Gammaproteobacteria bacterium]